MSLDYKRIFDYLQRVIHFETIKYVNEYTAILSTNEWPISGAIRAEISEYGTNELYVRYSGMASGCTISSKDSEEKNTEEVIKFILDIAKYNCGDKKILLWPFNCYVGYVGSIMTELEGSLEDRYAEYLKQNEVSSSKRVIKGWILDN